jgi:hypothetical protein
MKLFLWSLILVSIMILSSFFDTMNWYFLTASLGLMLAVALYRRHGTLLTLQKMRTKLFGHPIDPQWDEYIETAFRRSSLVTQTSANHHMQPEDMDQLGEYIETAFQRSSSAAALGGTGKSRDLVVQNGVLSWIVKVDWRLLDRATSSLDSHDGALLKMYQDIVITPKNLMALFRIVLYCKNSNHSTLHGGSMQCHALHFLYHWGFLTPTWRLRIPATLSENDESSSFSWFGELQITTLTTILARPSGEFCNCYSCRMFIWTALLHAVSRTQATDPWVDRILDLDHWPATLQANPAYVIKQPGLTSFYDEIIFVELHGLICRILFKDPENTKVKTFLRDQLGSCHELFRKSLRRIITGEVFTVDDNTTSSITQLKELENITWFLVRFQYCLAPVPVNSETKVLVRHARNKLFQHFLVNSDQSIDSSRLGSLE